MDNNSYMTDQLESNITLNSTVAPGIRLNNYAYYMAALVLCWTNCVLIVGLNIAVIVTIVRYKKKSRLYFFLLNLAIADLLTGLIDAFPHSIERSVGLPYTQTLWIFGEVMCKIQKTAANMPMTASNYILAATSLDRAMVIYKPMMSFKRGNILQKCIIVGCWVFSFFVSVPYLKLMVLQHAMDGWFHCNIDWGGADPVYMWKVFMSVLFGYVFLVPFIVIVVSYAILLGSLHKRAVNTSKRLNNPSPHTASRVFNQGLPKTKRKSIKLTCGIILGFLASWLVFFVVMFMATFAGFSHPINMVVVTFYYWNSVSNPIMFFIYHRRQPRRATSWGYSSDSGGRNTTYSSEMHMSGKTNVTDKQQPFYA